MSTFTLPYKHTLAICPPRHMSTFTSGNLGHHVTIECHENNLSRIFPGIRYIKIELFTFGICLLLHDFNNVCIMHLTQDTLYPMIDLYYSVLCRCIEDAMSIWKYTARSRMYNYVIKPLISIFNSQWWSSGLPYKLSNTSRQHTFRQIYKINTVSRFVHGADSSLIHLIS
jgi:hypothetical protein